jgi:hypothetical protein
LPYLLVLQATQLICKTSDGNSSHNDNREYPGVYEDQHGIGIGSHPPSEQMKELSVKTIFSFIPKFSLAHHGEFFADWNLMSCVSLLVPKLERTGSCCEINYVKPNMFVFE